MRRQLTGLKLIKKMKKNEIEKQLLSTPQIEAVRSAIVESMRLSFFASGVPLPEEFQVSTNYIADNIIASTQRSLLTRSVYSRILNKPVKKVAKRHIKKVIKKVIKKRK